MNFLKNHKEFSVASFVALVLVIAGWLWSYLALGGIAQPLIIHFTHDLGINEIGSIANLHAIGLLALLMILIDIRIAFVLSSRNRIWSNIVLIFTVFLALLIFIGFTAIISINK